MQKHFLYKCDSVNSLQVSCIKEYVTSCN